MLCTLNLSNTNIVMLPQWVTTASTLECIDLENCTELLELPKGIGNLKRLIVLNIKGCIKLSSMPSGLGELTCLRKLGLFVVGCGDDDASISVLENLDKLRGHLEIRNLKYLKDPTDAGKTYLKHMSYIQSMVLDWSLSETEEELLCDMEQVQGTLSALEPPSQIKDMKINGYQGSCVPRWMMAQNNSSFCQGPCQFLSLTHLTVENCRNLKQMRGLWVLPALKFLILLEMANLEELWTITSDFENSKEEILRGQSCFPALSYIFISGCPRLNVKPYFPPSLENLHLGKSNMQLLSPANFSQMLPPRVNESSSSSSMHSAVCHLKELELIAMMMGSSSGWELLQHYTQLETFSIKGCDGMTQLPESIRSLTSLQKLSIDGCSTLGVLPDWLGELCSLRSLDVDETPMMHSLPQSTKHLRSLVTLQIGDWDNNLKQLPDVIQHLTSLEFLNLMGFAALTELPEWIGQLSALRQLWIQNCPVLECLPQSI
jgi:Leucine-rich repeat (LRR) protein